MTTTAGTKGGGGGGGAQNSFDPLGLYSDARKHGYQGVTRSVRLYRTTPSGGGVISKSEDGLRCAVTGRESLRIIQITDGSRPVVAGLKSSVGPGGSRLDASRNFWDGSGLKMDCASTDIAWAHGVLNNKVLTSARNGEVIVWDVHQSGTGRYERRCKYHLRSINAMSVSHVIHHYCITGSADGDMRVWDLRDMSRGSLIRVHHPASIRSLVFSPSTWQPLHACVGLDNGSIYRWDLKMGQRGLLDRLSVAHTSSVTSLDWSNQVFGQTFSPSDGSGGPGNGLGWLVSGGLDRHVKVWDLTSPGANARIPARPTYTLHPSFPVRRVAWRPMYECELAVVSNADFAGGLNYDASNGGGGGGGGGDGKQTEEVPPHAEGDAVEIWDVRRSWIPKWSVTGSAVEGSVTDLEFGNADLLWTQHSSGTFSQIDLRSCTKPLEAITSTSATWDVAGNLTFAIDEDYPWQVPYDDISPAKKVLAEKHQIKPKAIGDASYKPFSQDLATWESNEQCTIDTFKRRARGYLIHGKDRPALCAFNAEVAYAAEGDSVARTWLLLGASLSDLFPFPEEKAAPRPFVKNPVVPFQTLAPVVPPNYSFPSSISSPAQYRRASPSSQVASSVPPRSSSASASRRLTPASSNASSPRQLPSALPSLPSHTPRRPSFLAARDFGDPEFSRRPSVSLLRRPSVSTSGSHPISPVAERTSGSASLRHVGEGALDDSDSPSPSENAEDGAGSGEESSSVVGVAPSALVSPLLLPNRGIPTPSPLSRVAGQNRWSEDEGQESKSEGKVHGGDDDDDGEDDGSSSSHSPRSTDTESVRSGSSPPRLKRRLPNLGRSLSTNSKRRSSLKAKSRSRSSTVASFPAGISHAATGGRVPFAPPLAHQESQSSIRTVTAGDVSFIDPGVEGSVSAGGGVARQEDVFGEMRDLYQDRRRSIAVSEIAGTRASAPDGHRGLGRSANGGQLDRNGINSQLLNDDIDRAVLTHRRIELVQADESRVRELAWVALREMFEVFADEGDIQTCAMLALIASEELKIPKFRVTRVLESYLDLLTRYQLHECAAYLRKYCGVKGVGNVTLLETTIYSSCGICRKPLAIPAGSSSGSALAKGGYGFCLVCGKYPVKCAICQLPVRALLFQCSVCKHGGHQACFRDYSARGPSVGVGLIGTANLRSADTPPPPQSLQENDSGVSSGIPRRDLSIGPGDDGFSSYMTDISSDSPGSGFSPNGKGQHYPGAVFESAYDPASTRLWGYPCPTGCGHICWASNTRCHGASSRSSSSSVSEDG